MCPGVRSLTAAMAPLRHDQQPSSYLLELAAADDLPAFRRAVQEDNLSLVASSSWYGPSPKANTRALGLHLRTPAMVAALYGSTSVLSYVLSIAPSEAARASATDGATPLQLAAAGRAPSALAAAHLLLAAGASPPPHDNPSTTTTARAIPSSPTKQPDTTPERKPKKDYSCAAGAIHSGAAPAEDINAGVFGTDEFRMYSFKVNPCSRAYTHDWTECPFAHPGENARRRDPRRHAYTCVPCPDFRKDPASCRKGDACEYAHGVFESWLHPAQYRTRLCKDEVGCPRRICFFAHGVRQLRAVNPSAASMSADQSTNFSSSPSSFSSSPPRSSRPALTASLSSRELDFEVDQYNKQRMMMARSTSPPGYSSSDLVAAYVQALSLQQQQQQQQQAAGARNTITKPPMNSRAAAFSNRSQTFVHRSPSPALSASARSFASPLSSASVLDDWGSPNGKLDWGVQAAELRKSTSFGVNRPHTAMPEEAYSWLNESSSDNLAARWSDLEQMVA
ncbi:unnamed protein product [Alopecurus aequalis]